MASMVFFDSNASTPFITKVGGYIYMHLLRIKLNPYKDAFNIYGKKYNDISELAYKKGEGINDNSCVYTDIYGRRVLNVVEYIPTFDSADAAYDSFVEIYIFTNGTALFRRGGYRELSKLTALLGVIPISPSAIKTFYAYRRSG